MLLIPRPDWYPYKYSKIGLNTHDSQNAREMLKRHLLCVTGNQSVADCVANQLRLVLQAYAFCPHCIAHQSFVHVPWEWAFACLLHCSVHGTPLCVGCPSCGDLDPLPFGLIPVADHVPCQSCDAKLWEDPTPKGRGPSSHTVLAFESGYRAAWLGAAPHMAMLQGASSAQFRRFVDDTLRLVVNVLDERPLARYGKRQPSPGASRQELIGTISQLVVNASTDCDMYERRARYRKGLKVWKSLLVPLTPEARRSLARVSRAWPSHPILPSAASRLSPRAHQPERLILCGVRSRPLCPRFEYKHALNSAI